MTNYFLKINKRNSGFTLVEALVAISIFTTSILGLISIYSKGISDAGYAKRKIVATYLAQEGVEYVRNMRDTYVLYDATSRSNGWGGGSGFQNKLLSASCASVNGCYFDPQNLSYSSNNQPMASLSVTACGGACPSLLYYDPNAYVNGTGVYWYGVGSPSGFIRKILVTQVGTNQMKISSMVSWTQGSGSYNVTLSETLYNWMEDDF